MRSSEWSIGSDGTTENIDGFSTSECRGLIRNALLSVTSECAVDVTEGKQAEEALKKSEEKFSKAFRQSPMGLTITSAKDHRYIEVNETFERLTGWRREEVIGRTPFDIGLWVDPAGRLDFTKRVLANGLVQNFETRLRMRDGSIRVGLATAEAIELSGEPCIIAVAADITERKQAEQALNESQERLSGIIASAMDSIISVDEQHCIVVFNAAAEKMFGCSAAEAIGQPVERFIPERFRSAHATHIRLFGETGVTNRDMGALGSLWAVRADGEEFQIEASISQIGSGGRKLFTVILRDITERKLAEECVTQVGREVQQGLSQQSAGHHDLDGSRRAVSGRERGLSPDGRLQAPGGYWPHCRGIGLLGTAVASRGDDAAVEGKRTGDGVPTRNTQPRTEEIREAEVSAELIELDGQRCVLAITRDITETLQSGSAVPPSPEDGSGGAFGRGSGA